MHIICIKWNPQEENSRNCRVSVADLVQSQWTEGSQGSGMCFTWLGEFQNPPGKWVGSVKFLFVPQWGKSKKGPRGIPGIRDGFAGRGKKGDTNCAFTWKWLLRSTHFSFFYDMMQENRYEGDVGDEGWVMSQLDFTLHQFLLLLLRRAFGFSWKAETNIPKCPFSFIFGGAETSTQELQQSHWNSDLCQICCSKEMHFMGQNLLVSGHWANFIKHDLYLNPF